MTADQNLRTVYLGQFTHEHAEAIAGALEEAGIAWTFKQFGRLTKLFFAGDWGVRMFVDSKRIDDARSIVSRLSD
ncbi:MAG TPA: hypothetical protein VKV69_05825 [Actinomycetota bacterium]|nr:hypothetical protein [Actinomycetota bacterium]